MNSPLNPHPPRDCGAPLNLPGAPASRRRVSATPLAGKMPALPERNGVRTGSVLTIDNQTTFLALSERARLGFYEPRLQFRLCRRASHESLDEEVGVEMDHPRSTTGFMNRVLPFGSLGRGQAEAALQFLESFEPALLR